MATITGWPTAAELDTIASPSADGPFQETYFDRLIKAQQLHQARTVTCCWANPFGPVPMPNSGAGWHSSPAPQPTAQAMPVGPSSSRSSRFQELLRVKLEAERGSSASSPSPVPQPQAPLEYQKAFEQLQQQPTVFNRDFASQYYGQGPTGVKNVQSVNAQPWPHPPLANPTFDTVPWYNAYPTSSERQYTAPQPDMWSAPMPSDQVPQPYPHVQHPPSVNINNAPLMQPAPASLEWKSPAFLETAQPPAQPLEWNPPGPRVKIEPSSPIQSTGPFPTFDYDAFSVPYPSTPALSHSASSSTIPLPNPVTPQDGPGHFFNPPAFNLESPQPSAHHRHTSSDSSSHSRIPVSPNHLAPRYGPDVNVFGLPPQMPAGIMFASTNGESSAPNGGDFGNGGDASGSGSNGDGYGNGDGMGDDGGFGGGAGGSGSGSNGGDGDDGDHNHNGSGNPHPRGKKLALACHFCRRRKLKCDGRRPICVNCEKRNIECSYDESVRRRGPGKRTKEMRERAAREAEAAGLYDTAAALGALPTAEDIKTLEGLQADGVLDHALNLNHELDPTGHTDGLDLHEDHQVHADLIQELEQHNSQVFPSVETSLDDNGDLGTDFHLPLSVEGIAMQDLQGHELEGAIDPVLQNDGGPSTLAELDAQKLGLAGQKRKSEPLTMGESTDPKRPKEDWVTQ